jgi:hypothetical protein
MRVLEMARERAAQQLADAEMRLKRVDARRTVSAERPQLSRLQQLLSLLSGRLYCPQQGPGTSETVS